MSFPPLSTWRLFRSIPASVSFVGGLHINFALSYCALGVGIWGDRNGRLSYLRLGSLLSLVKIAGLAGTVLVRRAGRSGRSLG